MSNVIHDFSKASIDELEKIAIDRVDKDDQWAIVDWFDDTFLTKKLDIHDHLNDLQNYHKRMMDKYNIGEKKLKSIIKNVTFVDDTHSKIWANINTELDLVLNKIKALNEVIQPSNLAYISKDTLKARLDKVDKEFKEKMDKTDANIELLNKHIQEELYPPEWWESALSGAEGFTVSLIRNTTFQPLSELAGGLDKEASNNAIKNMDGIESWLREHTFDENAYLWGSKAGEITAGVIGIYEMIQGGILVFTGIAGETSGTLLMATGIGLPIGALVTTASGGLVAAGGASFTMGIATAGSSFERAGKPIEDTKADLSDLQEVDSPLESASKGASGAGKTLNADELKKIGTLGDNSGIRHVKGTEIDARNLFDNQVIKSTVKEVQSGVFVGQGADGFTYTFRAVSKSGPPTIDVNGISGLRKIKFLP